MGIDDRPTKVASLIRVIVADDSAPMRLMVKHALSTNPLLDVVGEARDGRELLSLVDGLQPDCIVLDVEMPVLGGMETLAELRRRNVGAAVVMLTGFFDQAVADQARAGGAAVLLEKSSGLRILATTICEVTAQAASEPGTSHPDSGGQPADGPLVSLSREESVGRSLVGDTAEEMATELRRFEYLVSHDFAAPLRIMKGFAALTREKYRERLDDSGQLYLDNIVIAADKMQTMVDDLLIYSRARRIRPNIVPVDLNAIMSRVRRSLATELEHRGASLDADDLPTILTDQEIVTTVMRHLVKNGIRFNTAPAPSVRILVDPHAPLDSQVILVRDNGVGIPEPQFDAVFDLFRRLNPDTESSGTGTGLALCRRLVSLLGANGSIAIESSSSSGTTVRLSLPNVDRAA